MNIKMGPTKELLKIIQQAKNEKPVNVTTEGIYNVNSNGDLLLVKESSTSFVLDELTDTSYSKKAKLDHEESILNTEEEILQDEFNIDYLESNANAGENSQSNLNSPVDLQAYKVQEERNVSRNKSKNVDLFKFSRYTTVEETLQQHPQGEKLIKAARKTFTETDRRALIRIVVSELICSQNDNHYPPHESLHALAKAIVAEFPLLKNTHSQLGYEHYYDPRTSAGFLSYRLITLRKKLAPEARKYKVKRVGTSAKPNIEAAASTSTTGLLAENEFLEKLTFLKYKYPERENKAAITCAMDETFSNRRNWILTEKPSISQILEQYPRLTDYYGEIIDKDFEILYPNKGDNFIAKFASYYVPRIIQYAKICKPDVIDRHQHINDENLRAILILIDLLPVTNSVKCKSTDKQKKTDKRTKERSAFEINPYKALLEVLSEVTSMKAFATAKMNSSTNSIQPYIVAITCLKPQFFIQGDGWILKRRNDSDFIPTFDLLFKFYYIFNLEYPVLLRNFFKFIECFIYQISNATFNVVTSLHVNLCSTNVQKIVSNQTINCNDSDDE